jgi:hypothetical protein
VKSRRPAKRRLCLEELEPRLVLSTVTSSSNWSGYAVTPSSGKVTSVSGSWVVPTVTGTGTAYSSVWVGIDGFNSSTVEQIGTSADVVNGVPQYYAWVEMFPAYPANLSMKVQPGDTISASVTGSGSGQFTLSITDTPKGGGATESFTTTQSLPGAAQSSAEWIVEAPSSGFGVLPLANFGSVTFSSASYAVNGGAASAIPAAASYAINLVNYSGTQASTSALNSSGTGFTVTYNAPTAPVHHHRWWWWWFQDNGGSPGTTPAPTGASGSSSGATTTPTGTSGSTSTASTIPTGALGAAPGATTTSTGLPTATSTTGTLSRGQTTGTIALVFTTPAPVTTQPTSGAPASVTLSLGLPLFGPPAPLAGHAAFAGTLDGGGGDQLTVPEDAQAANQPAAPAERSAPEASPDAVPTPTPTPVPAPAPDDVPASPDGNVLVRQQACDACFSAWRWEPAPLKAVRGAALSRVEEHGPSAGAAAGAAMALVLGGSWGAAREEEESRRRRQRMRYSA